MVPYQISASLVVQNSVLKLFRVTDADDGKSDNKAISVQLSWDLTELGNRYIFIRTLPLTEK